MAIALATVGASLVLVTVRSKVSETEALDPSVAVTLTAMVPTSELVGVPVKVRVEALKESQEGREEPLERVVVYVRLSPLSTSAKVLDGI